MTFIFHRLERFQTFRLKLFPLFRRNRIFRRSLLVVNICDDLKQKRLWGGRHSSVVLSALTIWQPRVRIPSTLSMLFHVEIETVLLLK